MSLRRGTTEFFANSISRLLLPVDGAHAASFMAEVKRLLSAEQKAIDYKSPDDGIVPDHRPTNTSIRVVAYLSCVLDATFTALEGLVNFPNQIGEPLAQRPKQSLAEVHF
ncbi:exocyst complex component SEC10B-like protein [Tanacetum coccineum]